jgi:hypothetical protein
MRPRLPVSAYSEPQSLRRTRGGPELEPGPLMRLGALETGRASLSLGLRLRLGEKERLRESESLRERLLQWLEPETGAI